MNKVALFLILAVAIATASFVLIGVLLLPALGVDAQWRTMISGGVSGGLIALVYFTMFRRELEEKVKAESGEPGAREFDDA
jgi:hypothetical protein